MHGNLSVCPSGDCSDPWRLVAPVAGYTSLFLSHRSERVSSRALLGVLCVLVVGLEQRAVGSSPGYLWVDPGTEKENEFLKAQKSSTENLRYQTAYNFWLCHHIIRRGIVLVRVVNVCSIFVKVLHILIFIVCVALRPSVCCSRQHAQPRHADHNYKVPQPRHHCGSDIWRCSNRGLSAVRTSTLIVHEGDSSVDAILHQRVHNGSVDLSKE